MKNRAFLGLFLGSMSLAAACGGSGTGGAGGQGTTSGTGGETSTSSSTSASSTSTSSTSTSTSSSGTGGGTSTSSSSTSSSSTTGSSSSGSAGTTDHLVISELGAQPAAGEFVEIYNPTAAAVDLTHYYLSDNAGYHTIATGVPWAPVTSNPGTDFLAQFPAGTMLAPGAAIAIATDPGFVAHYNKCPDFILAATALTCPNGTAPAMLAPTNGGIGDKAGTLLSNDREMVVLFYWDGTSTTVKDVDYLTWGTTFDAATRVDKTALPGYQPDTAAASQKSAAIPGSFGSIERCVLETGETLTGGNGLTGHDETSEPLDVNFKAQPAPTPGVKNACLP